jgi:hypothetical protein
MIRFVRFFFHQHTQTIAFAPFHKGHRVWGIDRDNRRGWHLHPVDNPASHLQIELLSVSDVVARLRDALEDHSNLLDGTL